MTSSQTNLYMTSLTRPTHLAPLERH
ncbi:BgTH12-07644 [Blumeria graminis f. sp. triticale]|uniref:BgTH12-07644 n=1 Tax=Blumeria graminis f. sp. triticale TaxID=1689686 RepID=A0A9W4GDH2_BLUGR|nr:BgTH12-07644 [Blumeria graminis f. sp. triticale]